ncbi:MAG: response regulator [Cyanobacteria bacterium P01_A01_bin.3]
MQQVASESSVSAATSPQHQQKALFSLMQKLFQKQLHGDLEIECADAQWLVCLHEGQLYYASHSIDPLGRLASLLRRLSFDAPKLTSRVREQACVLFGQRIDGGQDRHAYHCVMDWLLKHGYVTEQHVETLTSWWIANAIELLLLERDGQYQLSNVDRETHYCLIEPESILQQSFDHLSAWTDLGIAGASIYQRPYFFNHELACERLSEVVVQKLSSFLRGDSFFQLAAKLHRQEIDVVKGLHAYILSGTIVLRDPKSPYDKLPRITPQATARIAKLIRSLHGDNVTEEETKDDTRQYTIVCIDDSPAILNQLSRFLDGDRFDVHTISNPLRAMMSIARIKPDAILLDIGMPNVDGYELCRLIRNHSNFKDTPIVMVTGHTGIFDRARAKLSGASGYLTKPFTQAELIELLTKHLEAQ